MNFSKTFRTVLAGLMLVAVPANMLAVDTESAQASVFDWVKEKFEGKDNQTLGKYALFAFIGFSLLGRGFITDILDTIWNRVLGDGQRRVRREIFNTVLGDEENFGTANNGGNNNNRRPAQDHPELF